MLPMSGSKVLKVEGWCSCEGCMAKINKVISKTPGVQSKSVDSEKGSVTINGTVDTAKLVKKMESKMKKKVTILPGKDQKEEIRKLLGGEMLARTESNTASEETWKNKKMVVYGHGDGLGSGYGAAPSGVGDRVPATVYAPQIFSDENPSACYIQ